MLMLMLWWLLLLQSLTANSILKNSVGLSMLDQCLAFLEKAHPDRCCRNQSAEYTPAVAEKHSSFTPPDFTGLEKSQVSDFRLHVLKIHRGTKAKVQKLQVPLGGQHQVVRLQVT